jgi:hypothetical protein
LQTLHSATLFVILTEVNFGRQLSYLLRIAFCEDHHVVA